jgi:hypothetical protein
MDRFRWGNVAEVSGRAKAPDDLGEGLDLDGSLHVRACSEFLDAGISGVGRNEHYRKMCEIGVGAAGFLETETFQDRHSEVENDDDLFRPRSVLQEGHRLDSILGHLYRPTLGQG